MSPHIRTRVAHHPRPSDKSPSCSRSAHVRPRPARLSRADLGLRREWFLLDGGPGVGDPARTRNGCSTAKLRFLRCLRRPTVVALPWTSGPSRSRSDALHPEIQFYSIRRPSGTPGDPLLKAPERSLDFQDVLVQQAQSRAPSVCFPCPRTIGRLGPMWRDWVDRRDDLWCVYSPIYGD